MKNVGWEYWQITMKLKDVYERKFCKIVYVESGCGLWKGWIERETSIKKNNTGKY
jgi:hypothetical protein